MAVKQEFKKFGRRFLVFSGLLLALGLCRGEVRGEDDFRSASQLAKASGVSEEIVSRILVVGYRYNLESKDLVGFLVVVAEVEKRQLPIEPFVGKIEEGLAKRVEAPLIQQVLRQDLIQYGFVRDLLQKRAITKDSGQEKVRSREMVRLARALSMGISQEEMEILLNEAPRVSMGEMVDAVEFTAALKQAGQEFPDAKEITVVGLQSGFFTRTAWSLPLMVSAAKTNHLPEDKIRAAALDVVIGNKTVLEAHTGLGLDPERLARGPIVSGPSSGSARGANTGKGQTDAAGQGGQGSGAPGIGGGGAGPGGDGGAGGGGGGSGR